MKKINVIKKYVEFEEIISLRHFRKSRSYSVFYRKKNEKFARVGIIVGKKNGIAVERVKIKRQVRSIIDSVLDYKENLDIVVAISKNYSANDFEKNKNELVNLLISIKGEINE